MRYSLKRGNFQAEEEIPAITLAITRLVVREDQEFDHVIRTITHVLDVTIVKSQEGLIATSVNSSAMWWRIVLKTTNMVSRT